MKRFIVTVLTILTCYLLQTTVFQGLAIAGVVPNILLIMVVAAGYMKGKMYGLLVGLCAGLLIDLLEGDVIGLYTMFYMVIGYLNGYAHKIYYHDDTTMPLILVAISDFVLNFVVYVVSFLLRSRLDLFFYFRTIMLPDMIYTVLISVFLYRLLHIIHRRLERSREEKDL